MKRIKNVLIDNALKLIILVVFAVSLSILYVKHFEEKEIADRAKKKEIKITEKYYLINKDTITQKYDTSDAAATLGYQQGLYIPTKKPISINGEIIAIIPDWDSSIVNIFYEPYMGVMDALYKVKCKNSDVESLKVADNCIMIIQIKSINEFQFSLDLSDNDYSEAHNIAEINGVLLNLQKRIKII